NWLVQQIESPQVMSSAFATLPSSSNNMARLLNARKEVKRDKKSDEETDAKRMVKETQKELFIDEVRARIDHAVTTETPFYERLVGFWSNHFTVSVKKGLVAGLAGAYEREAIRPYVTGKFADMLLAVAHHPAMLVYLDNAQSIGPHS